MNFKVEKWVSLHEVANISVRDLKINDIIISRHLSSEYIKIIRTQEEIERIKNCRMYFAIDLKRNDEQIIDQEYLYHYLTSNHGRRTIKRYGEGHSDRISTEMIHLVKIPIIPIPEQIQVKKTLNKIDEKINNLQQLIEANRKLKRGIMQKIYMEEKTCQTTK